jgi:protoporphyrin/coproporphyrin ferrochelatase
MNSPITTISLSSGGERVGVRGNRGVLLVNVGTPEAPTTPAVRKYLAEFLDDPRVLDVPPFTRWLLLNLIILPFRPSRSAHAYQQIWTPEGSPLLVNAKKQAAALQAAMPGVHVELGMAYGKPSLADALGRFKERGVTQVTLVPMFPQYASATTGSIIEGWHKLLGLEIEPPTSSLVHAFHAHPGFIAAAAERIRETVKSVNPEHVLFSFHGLPVRQLKPYCEVRCESTECPPLDSRNAHCYGAQCYATTRALIDASGLPLEMTSTAFQSRLKGATWLSPFTDEAVAALGKRGVKRLAVACPSFVADCLETLEEIGMRAAETFREAGGESLTLIPAVNDSPKFIEMLAAELGSS